MTTCCCSLSQAAAAGRAVGRGRAPRDASAQRPRAWTDGHPSRQTVHRNDSTIALVILEGRGGQSLVTLEDPL